MLEVQEIFLAHGDSYRHEHKVTLEQRKAMSAIEKCQTAALGGHTDICNECGYTKISYNSCRNRHCPKCQTLAKERWIDNQNKVLRSTDHPSLFRCRNPCVLIDSERFAAPFCRGDHHFASGTIQRRRFLADNMLAAHQRGKHQIL